jgi:TetR/AcrR family transcriptional repressor of nem operon
MHHTKGDGKMRYDAEHKEKTRQRVLKEAAKAIRAEGPHRVGVAGVMAKAGLTHGGFYAHFASKDELIAEAIGKMFEDAGRRFAHESQGRGPAAALAAYIDFYLSAAHRDSPAVGCPLPSLSADLPRMTELARERFGRGVAGLIGKVADKLLAMDRLDADALASSTVAELVGALSLSRAVADPAQSDAILDNSRAALKARLGLEINA